MRRVIVFPLPTFVRPAGESKLARTQYTSPLTRKALSVVHTYIIPQQKCNVGHVERSWGRRPSQQTGRFNRKLFCYMYLTIPMRKLNDNINLTFFTKMHKEIVSTQQADIVSSCTSTLQGRRRCTLGWKKARVMANLGAILGPAGFDGGLRSGRITCIMPRVAIIKEWYHFSRKWRDKLWGYPLWRRPN